MNFYTVDHDNGWGMRERVYFDADRIVTETVQDFRPTAERNKFEYNHYDGTSKSKAWRKDMVHVARVPLVVLEELVKQGILTRGYKIRDDARFDNWLNDPDNRMFRTLPGRV